MATHTFTTITGPVQFWSSGLGAYVPLFATGTWVAGNTFDPITAATEGNGFQFTDDGGIPGGATINSVTLNVRHKESSAGTYQPTWGAWDGNILDSNSGGGYNGHALGSPGTSFVTWSSAAQVLDSNSSPWTVAALFTTIWGVFAGPIAPHNPANNGTYTVDNASVSLTVDYTASTSYWVHTNTKTGFSLESYVQSVSVPTTFSGEWILFGTTPPALQWWCNVTNGWSVYQVNSPGTGFSACSGPTDNDGWYVSPEAYGGSIVIVNGGRPKNPRKWTDISVWAAAGTAMLGGSPAASSVFDNHMVYAAGVYTVGTDYPPIRVFDGSFDRELCRLPPTTSSTIPKAVLSMLTANNKVYVTSFDSGTTSADWRGRVFELDLASGVLTVLGTNFAAGEMPYALAWHMGRLWCGTNNGIGTVGKVYYFRPGIDTVWTLDHSLATETLGGVDSMASYAGKLYVGSDNAAAARGKVLVRDTAGAYTVSDTGVGGAAVVNNGYLSMVVFGTNLYASYWNKDTPNISIIRKFNGSAWSTVYTGASTTLRPYIMLFVDNATLFAVGGGSALTGAIVATTDGTTWTDLTPQLFEASKTLLPVYGVEIL